jgi:hypothetical protein
MRRHGGGKMTRKRIGIMAGFLLILGAGGYLGLKLYIEKDARGRIQQWANQAAGITCLSYQSLDVGIFSKTIRVGQVSLQIKDTDSPVSIDKLVLYSFDSNNEIPSFMHVGIQGIHISRSNSFMAEVAPVLAQLGYADIEADVEYAYRYDPIKKDLEIQRICIHVSGMGQMEVSARLNNLDLAVVKSVPNNPLTLIALVPAVAISGITLNYTDHSIVRRLIQMGARQSGQNEDQFISGIITQLSQEIQKQKLPAARDRLLAVQNFIKNPGVIEVAISPLQPVPLMRFIMMDNAEQIVDLLNISINYHKVN